MIYKFKSKATGDLIMLGPQGDQVMRLLGRQPSATGIIDVDDMPQVLAQLEQAVVDDDAARAAPAGHAVTNESEASQDSVPEDLVTLRQRVWPLVEVIKRAYAERQPLVWGV